LKSFVLAAALVLLGSFVIVACAPQRHETALSEYRGFAPPQRVTIRGYDGEAMEPFITRDGRYLFFNNRNDVRDTNLYYAERIDDLTFDYRGELKGANSPVLDAVPSMDRDGNFYFISTRSYFQTLSTLYRGRFRAGTLSGVELVAGVSLERAGALVFDAEISPLGDVLFFADGEFAGGPVPKSADIAIAVREGAGFRRHPASAEFMRNVNTAALEYAPSISADLRELFFTRARPGEVAIYRSQRRSRDEPFDVPERVAAIAGFAEAPSLSGDGRSLYYHRLDGKRYVIYRVTRP
jgi:Tol biopolymer transport system component